MATGPFRLKNGRRSPRITSSQERLPSYDSDGESLDSDTDSIASENVNQMLDSDLSPPSSTSSAGYLSPFDFNFESFQSSPTDKRPTNLLEKSIASLPAGSDLKNTLIYIRKQMKHCLLRLKELEETARNVPTLHVRISVLQEEKRQLLKQLQTKMSMKKSRYGCNDLYYNAIRQRGCKSDTEDDDDDGFSSVRRKLRAKLSSSATSLHEMTDIYKFNNDKTSETTDVSYVERTEDCQPKIGVIDRSLVEERDQRNKVQSARNISTRSIGVGMMRSFTRDFGVGNSMAVIEMKDEGNQNVPITTTVACDSLGTDCCDKSTMAKPVLKSTGSQSNLPLWIPFSQPDVESSATQTPPKPTKVSIGVGLCTVDDDCSCLCGMSKSVDEIMANKIVLPVLISRGVGDLSVEDAHLCDKCCRSKRTVACETELKHKTVGVGSCRVTDTFCTNCDTKTTRSIGTGDSSIHDVIEITPQPAPDNHRALCENVSRTIGVGDCRVTDNDCRRCLNLQTKSIGVGCDEVYLLQKNKEKYIEGSVTFHINGHLDPQTFGIDDKKLLDDSETASNGSATLTYVSNESHDSDESSIDHDNPSSDSTGQMSEPSNAPNGQRSGSRVSEDVLSACKLLHGHLYNGKEVGREQLVSCMCTVESNWFEYVTSPKCHANIVKSFTKTISQYIPVLLETFVNLKDKNGNNALHYAVTYGNWKVVDVLLSTHGINVDLFNQAGYTAVMLASLTGLQREGVKDIARRLLDMGDVNKKVEETGQTPLMLAVSCGKLDMVELLLEADADINAQDDECSTALMCACEHGRTDVARILLASPNCNSSVQDNEGSTALSIAMERNFHDLALLIYGHSNFTYHTQWNKKISTV